MFSAFPCDVEKGQPALRENRQDSESRTPRAEFGSYLREFRELADMRQKDLAARLDWSVSKISMVERGDRGADEDFVRRADAVLGAGGELLARWREIIEYGLRRPVYLAQLAEVEQRADTLRYWQPIIIPGMLQTPEYARAVFQGKPHTAPEEVEQNVAARLERQRLLEREDRPAIWAILDELALIRPIGNETVMAGQMAHLVELDERPGINIRVLPRDSWLTTGLQGAFILASGPGMPDTAYLEAVTLGQITADGGRVRDVRSRYEMLHNEALSRRASVQLIREIAETWTK
jgi:transcriptional regulator with XRE-family HTH domain